MMKISILVIGIWAAVPLARAQHCLVALADGKPQVVRGIDWGRPVIEEGGKAVPVSGVTHYALANMPVYQTGFVKLENFRVGTSYVVTQTGDTYNHRMRIYGRATSDTAFADCYMVFELNPGKGRTFAFAKMPDLPAHEPVELNLGFDIEEHLEHWRYRLHLFSGPTELLHSQMPAAYVARQQQKIKALIDDGKPSFPPVLAERVAPVYPKTMRGSGVVGKVRVKCHVDQHGRVTEAKLLDASPAEFGEPALAAVRQWEFDPAIKQTHFVAADVVVPIEMRPPHPKK